MRFVSSDPYAGVGLSPAVKAVRYDEHQGLMYLEVAPDGDENPRYDVAINWQDRRLVDVVASWVGNWGMGINALCRVAAGVFPELSPEDVKKTIGFLFLQLSKPQALRWWFAPDLNDHADDRGEAGPRWSVRTEEPLCHVESLSRLFCAPLVVGEPSKNAVLSRFAFLRRDGDRTVLENPELFVQLVLGADGAHLLPMIFAGHKGANEAEDKYGFWHFLWRCGFLEVPEQDTPDRQGWGFHEKLFHNHSRSFLGQRTIGMTYRFRDVCSSPPAHKPPMSEDKTALDRPDAEKSGGGKPFYDVLDARKSLRSSTDNPLTLDDIGSFLWRTVATRTVYEGGGQELISRPVPAGGSIHELEFYLVINRCAGLAPGMYHYHGGDHALYKLPEKENVRLAITSTAGGAMGISDKEPDCIIVMATRLLRLGWKYEGLPYRLSLLHAGVVMEAFYLVATEMGLSACATGTGDSALFAMATGIPIIEETSIAEFVLNGRSSGAQDNGA